MANVYYMTSIPQRNFGTNGDIVVASLKSKGNYLFAKLNNRWSVTNKLVSSENSIVFAEDSNAIHVNKPNEISAVSLKGSPENSDVVIVEDSSDSYNKKSSTISSLRTAMFQNNVFETQCLADTWSLTVMDGLGYLVIPTILDGWYLVDAQAHVSVASSGNLPKFMFHNETTAKDMFTATQLTIDVGELDSASATTPVVIDITNDQVSKGDRIRFDCDVAGTGTKGLMIISTFNKER